MRFESTIYSLATEVGFSHYLPTYFLHITSKGINKQSENHHVRRADGEPRQQEYPDGFRYFQTNYL